MRYTWDGMRTFMKVETAAAHAIEANKDPRELKILSEGRVTPAEEWDIEDLLAHIRDQV